MIIAQWLHVVRCSSTWAISIGLRLKVAASTPGLEEWSGSRGLPPRQAGTTEVMTTTLQRLFADGLLVFGPRLCSLLRSVAVQLKFDCAEQQPAREPTPTETRDEAPWPLRPSRKRRWRIGAL